MARVFLTFCGLGCAGAYAYRGDWASTALAGAGVILAAAFWLRGEMADTRAMMRAAMREVLREATTRRRAS